MVNKKQNKRKISKSNKKVVVNKTKQKQDKRKIIDKDSVITDLFQKFPEQSAEIMDTLTSKGLHCIGCGVAMFETIEQGMLAHGFNKKDIDKLIEKLNKIVSNR